MPDRDDYLGYTVDDPLRGLPEGFAFRCEAVRAERTEESLQAASKDWSLLNGVMLSVGFGNFEHTSVLGSAVMVAPGVAICAWHVLAEGLQTHRQTTDWLVCMAVAGSTLRMWGVQSYNRVDGTDLVLLNLRLRTAIQKEDSFHQAVVTSRIPAVGEMVTVIGTSAVREKYFGALGKTPDTVASMELALHIAKGPVTERYIPLRDRVMLSWPCLEVNCPAPGGTSGGPVFDASGALIGIVCSSVESEGGTGPAYISLIYPALIAAYEGGWPAQLFQGRQILLHNPYCMIDGREAFEPVKESMEPGDSVSYLFHYS